MCARYSFTLGVVLSVFGEISRGVVLTGVCSASEEDGGYGPGEHRGPSGSPAEYNGPVVCQGGQLPYLAGQHCGYEAKEDQRRKYHV